MPRNAGLDAARAVAVLMVLFGHLLSMLVTSGAAIRACGAFGTLGVELFFALSGFLIGQRILALRPAGLPRFLAARWLRTLPMYYATLMFLAWMFQAFNPHEFLFVQTFFPADLDYLPGGWSLAVEEAFYLLFPIAALTLARLAFWPMARAVATLAIAAILACLAARLIAAIGDLAATVSYGRHTLFRLDAAAPGVLAAWFWRRDSATIIRRLSGPAGVLTILAAIAVTAGWIAWRAGYGPPPGDPRPHPYDEALIPTLAGIPFALTVLVCASRLPSWQGAPAAFAGFLARISYSIYLVQFPLIAFLYPALIARLGAWSLPPMLAAVIGTATLTHVLIERPFMRLRPVPIG